MSSVAITERWLESYRLPRARLGLVARWLWMSTAVDIQKGVACDECMFGLMRGWRFLLGMSSDSLSDSAMRLRWERVGRDLDEGEGVERSAGRDLYRSFLLLGVDGGERLRERGRLREGSGLRGIARVASGFGRHGDGRTPLL